MNNNKLKNITRTARKRRIRSRIIGTKQRPRLSVFRSLNYITAQLIDDENSNTLVYIDDRKLKGKTKIERAAVAGKKIAEMAKEKDIKKVVFDRGGYRYHGRVKALADSARANGLEF